MKARLLTEMSLFGALALSVTASAGSSKLITFDVPQAGTGAGQGTVPYGINNRGEATGYYTDAKNISHGFVRAPDGTLTTIDIPGDVNGSAVNGINEAGDITGAFCDGNAVCHGFVRSRQGDITTFDVPGAAGTYAGSINPAGEISGYYQDANGVWHGFVRSRQGDITTFDAPGGDNIAGDGTLLPTFAGINPGGAAEGYVCNINACAGFLRAADGNITTFDVAGTGFTIALGINPASIVIGYFYDASTNTLAGFARSRDGNFTTFNYLDGGNPRNTFPATNNAAGEIVGFWGFQGVRHGFARDVHGNITSFDIPGAGSTPGSNQGTYGNANNDRGDVTGDYIDASNVFHGFLLTK